MDNELSTVNTLIADRSALLPNEITEILTNGTLEVVIFEIQEDFKLNRIQLKLLENEIALTVLLFVSPEDFTERIQSSLEIEPEAAEQIALRVKQSIFEKMELVFELIFAHQQNKNGSVKSDQLKNLEQNFKSLREEALQSKSTSVTPSAESPVPENLPTGEPAASVLETDETPTIAIPHAITKTSYTVEPMRTMASDVTRIHGYGAYRDLFPDEAGEQTYKEEVIKSAPQEELLQEKPKLTQKPTYGNE